MNDKQQNVLDLFTKNVEPVKTEKVETLPTTKKSKKDNLPTATNEEISFFLSHELQVASLPKIDLKDVVAVKERTELYFRMCQQKGLKPTNSGYACALGTTTQNLYSIRNDLSHIDTKEAEIIKKAYQVLEQMWEDYMLNGKVNPVTGIFLAKNNFGYVDSKEVSIKAEHKVTTDDPEEIRRKYMAEFVEAEAEIIDK